MINITKPEISVIVPAYKAEHTIEPCLDALFSQKTDVSYEVILVHYLTDVKSEKLINKYQHLILIHQDKPLPPGLMRNIGAREAKGEYILFIDADVVIDNKVLQIVKENISKGYRIFSGSIGISPLGKKNLWVYLDHFYNFNEFQPRMKSGLRKNLISTLLGIEKNLFIESGMFSNLHRMEDTELSERINKKGEKLLFVPEIEGEHIYVKSDHRVFKKPFINGVNTYSIRYGKIFKGFIGNIALLVLLPLAATAKTIRIFCRNVRYRQGREKIYVLFLFPLMLFCGIFWMFGVYMGIIALRGKTWRSGLVKYQN